MESGRTEPFFAELFVAGIPKGDPRGRAAYAKKMGRAFIYKPGTAKAWQQAIRERLAMSVAPDPPLAGPVLVSITFMMPRPKRLMRKKDPDGPIYHIAKPDRDNLDKAVLDAFTQAGWWKDDCQVCDGPIRKYYHAKKGQPGAWIRVMELRGDDQ